MEESILVIPDVHGRRFWREAVEAHPELPVVFLGDYMDPYPAEGIDQLDALDNFREIIDYARSCREKCILLLGNHDLHYITDFGLGCRYNDELVPALHRLFTENADLFQLAYMSGDVLFTHAAVLPEWAAGVGAPDTPAEVSAYLNDLLLDHDRLRMALDIISPVRGGSDMYASPVWADVRDIRSNPIDGAYSVFGHTQMTWPKITDTYACLDCRQAFIIGPGHKITPAVPDAANEAMLGNLLAKVDDLSPEPVTVVLPSRMPYSAKLARLMERAELISDTVRPITIYDIEDQLFEEDNEFDRYYGDRSEEKYQELTLYLRRMMTENASRFNSRFIDDPEMLEVINRLVFKMPLMRKLDSRHIIIAQVREPDKVRGIVENMGVALSVTVVRPD